MSENADSSTSAVAGAECPRSWLERALGVVTVVKGGEGVTALLMASNFFLLLTSYYLLKTVREALILSESGAAVKTYSSAGQALLLLLIVPAFGALASRVNRIQLIQSVTLFFASHLVIFYMLGIAGFHQGVIYFLWVGIFNVLVIAQFWAFANDIYTPAQGKRLFPLVGLGASLGAWIGALVAGRLVKDLGPFPLLLIGAILLVGCVVICRYLNTHSIRDRSSDEKSRAQQPLGKEGGFALVLKDRYLLLIAVLTILLNVVNTSGEFLLSKIVVSQAEQAFPGAEMLHSREKFVGEFYGNYFGWVNLVGLLLQTFVVSRVFTSIGVGGAMLIGPIIAICGYSLMALVPVLGLIRIVKIADNSNDYSIQKTATQALYLPTSREAKYKAKTAIDTFFMRLGDVTQAGIVFIGTALSFSLATFATVNVVLAILWLLTAFRLRHKFREKGGE